MRATRRLLSEPEPPTAIAFDSPTLGVSGLGVAQQMGLSVPEDMSIVAWDDSLICQVVHPPLTTLTRDITAFGSAACRLLREVIDTPGEVGHVETPRAELTPRASTGPAAAARPCRSELASVPMPRRPRVASARSRDTTRIHLTLNRISGGLLPT